MSDLTTDVERRQCSICGRKFPDGQDAYLHRMQTNGHCRSQDSAIHQERMQERYLVWYEGKLGGLFSIDVDHTLRAAEANRDLFIADGYEARVIRLAVVDGEPGAGWVGKR